MTDPGPGDRQTTVRVKCVTNQLIFKIFDQNLDQFSLTSKQCRGVCVYDINHVYILICYVRNPKGAIRYESNQFDSRPAQ